MKWRNMGRCKFQLWCECSGYQKVRSAGGQVCVCRENKDTVLLALEMHMLI